MVALRVELDAGDVLREFLDRGMTMLRLDDSSPTPAVRRYDIETDTFTPEKTVSAEPLLLNYQAESTPGGEPSVLLVMPLPSSNAFVVAELSAGAFVEAAHAVQARMER